VKRRNFRELSDKLFGKAVGHEAQGSIRREVVEVEYGNVTRIEGRYWYRSDVWAAS
jgi:hypothetical protein